MMQCTVHAAIEWAICQSCSYR